MNNTISIIVPVFRVEKYLRDCLRSLLTGQGDDYEVIAVNDCSPDGSARILHEYEQVYPHLKVIEFRQNQGVSAARNAGITAAKGDWLMFCDSDDALLPGTIPLLKAKIDAYDCELITFELKRVQDANEKVEDTIGGVATLHNMNDENDATEFVCRNFPHRLWAWNKCIRRDLIGDLRFHDYQPCEDAVFSLDCILRAKTILELPNVCYKYVQHEGSCLKSINFKRINGDICGMRELAEVVCRWRFFPRVRRSMYFQLRNTFLHGIERNLRRCTEESETIRHLETMYLISAKRVFVELPISRSWDKVFYRIVFSLQSVRVVGIIVFVQKVFKRLYK